jgi:hemerythrin-like metal-binding protein
MALVTWNSSYSVKVEACDAQHRKLFDIINELAEAMRVGQGREAVAKTVRELLEYTRSHFAAEEALMRKAGYSQLAAHQEMHRKFEADVAALEQQAKQGRTTNSIQVLNLLRDWLVNHIVKVDQQYSEHLNAAGIQ